MLKYHHYFIGLKLLIDKPTGYSIHLKEKGTILWIG